MLEDLTPPARVIPCAIRTILEQLDESDQNILLNALADTEAWSNNALARALTDRGLRISEKPIRKHRSRYCSCK